MIKEKKALIILHQRRSSVGRVGYKLWLRGYKLDIKKPALGEQLPNTMDNHDLVVIYGGSMSANDSHKNKFIRNEIAWIDVALKSNKPFLGICLGAQMLAKNLGGAVQSASDKSSEIGFFDIIPSGMGTKIFQKQTTFFQWHNEGFIAPESCEILAKGTTFQQQAFKYKRAYGIQFHPEVNLRMHLTWLHFAAHKLRDIGAQSRLKQLNLRIKHGKNIDLWLDQFLDNYLLKQ